MRPFAYSHLTEEGVGVQEKASMGTMAPYVIKVMYLLIDSEKNYRQTYNTHALQSLHRGRYYNINGIRVAL